MHKDYGSTEKNQEHFVRAGKLAWIPWKIVRFSAYLLCLVCLQFVNIVSSKYALDFQYEYSFEERPEWKYLDVDWRQLLRYKVRRPIEKKN